MGESQPMHTQHRAPVSQVRRHLRMPALFPVAAGLRLAMPSQAERSRCPQLKSAWRSMPPSTRHHTKLCPMGKKLTEQCLQEKLKPL